MLPQPAFFQAEQHEITTAFGSAVASRQQTPAYFLKDFSVHNDASTMTPVENDFSGSERQSIGATRANQTCTRTESNGIQFGDDCNMGDVRIWLRYGFAFSDLPIAPCPDITEYEGGGYLRHACSFACDDPELSPTDGDDPELSPTDDDDPELSPTDDDDPELIPTDGAYIEYKVGKYRDPDDLENGGFDTYTASCSVEAKDAVLGNIGVYADQGIKSEYSTHCQSQKEDMQIAMYFAVHKYMHADC